MSIQDVWGKIKGNSLIDKTTILYLFTILGVGIAAFGLGRMSVNTTVLERKNMIITQAGEVSRSGELFEKTSGNRSAVPIQSSKSGIEKNYIASKNGKLYYPSGCKSANRIKPENRVWFEQAIDAEKGGYSRSSSCNK